MFESLPGFQADWEFGECSPEEGKGAGEGIEIVIVNARFTASVSVSRGKGDVFLSRGVGMQKWLLCSPAMGGELSHTSRASRFLSLLPQNYDAKRRMVYHCRRGGAPKSIIRIDHIDV